MFDGKYQFQISSTPNRIFKNHRQFLYALILEDIPDARLWAKSNLANGDFGLRQIIVLGDLSAGRTIIMDISDEVHDYDSYAGDRIRNIQFYVESSEDTITLYPYTPKSDNPLVIYYQNSLGGLDSIICEGDQQPGLETFGFERDIAMSYDDNITDNSQYSYVNEGARETITIFANGPKKEITALRDLYLIKNCWIIEDGQWIPMIVQGSSYDLPSTRSNINRPSITLKYAHNEHAFDQI